MLSNPYLGVPDVLLTCGATFAGMMPPKKGQFGIPLPNQIFQKHAQTIQKPKKPQRKRYRVAPRKAAMISTCPISPESSPVSNSPPPTIDISHNQSSKNNESLDSFLDSFQNHIPSSFDIVKRGNLPGIQLSPLL